ncbi:hypothetical protein [Embleya sp. NPDC059259]|uniref:hypothetical protein n=1 Tax=unclassified Embleya TaxID=2699296 RepID=UPI0036A215B2
MSTSRVRAPVPRTRLYEHAGARSQGPSGPPLLDRGERLAVELGTGHREAEPA